MEEFSGKLVAELEAQSYRCVSVDLQPEFSRETSPDLGIASKWSHRHAAFAAGLGTFGLSDGFISEKGKAIRITSMVIEADLELYGPEGQGPLRLVPLCLQRQLRRMHQAVSGSCHR